MTSSEGFATEEARGDHGSGTRERAKPGWEPTPPRSWVTAYGRAIVVLLYFAVATVWLPSYLIGSTTDEGFREIVVTVSWLATFGGGVWALTELHKRGWL